MFLKYESRQLSRVARRTSLNTRTGEMGGGRHPPALTGHCAISASHFTTTTLRLFSRDNRKVKTFQAKNKDSVENGD